MTQYSTITAKHSQIHVGGRLTLFLSEWKKITSDKWVLDTIENGYKLKFIEIPHFLGIKPTKISGKNMHLVQKEINCLLGKHAVEKVSAKASRFLQHIVSSLKEERGNETRNKFEASQSILGQETFQDEYFEQDVKPGYERRLGTNNRFKRCILPFENFQRSL